MNHVGIDVSSKELVVVISVNGKQRKAQMFDNTPEGHLALCRALHKLPGEESLICMEATGVYHFDLAVLLSRSIVSVRGVVGADLRQRTGARIADGGDHRLA